MTRVLLFKVTLKDGRVTLDDIKGLSQKLGKHWKWLGRGLKVCDSDLVKLDNENKELEEKAYQMLLHWDRIKGSAATYEVLFEALKHDHVKRKDLAEHICLLNICTS